MNFSQYQIDIFKATDETNKNIVVNATAGSGKTTILVEISKRIPRFYPSIFLAFNKSIVEELKVKLSRGFKCSTIHAYGMKILYNNYSNIDLNQYKTFGFSQDYVRKNGTKKIKDSFFFNVSQLWSLLRLNGYYIDNEDVLNQICDYYGISMSKKEIKYAVDIIHNIIEYNQNKVGEISIDYTDMVTLPLIKRFQFDKYKVVLIDEGQDLNKAQQDFALNLVDKGGRTIFVGDKHQAIYSFAGADADSFNRFEKRDNTISLPLNLSYRCGKHIVANANKINPDMRAFEGNPDGIVRNGIGSEVQVGDMVICRNNAPILEFACNLIKTKIPVTIKGDDLKQFFRSIVKKNNNLSIDAFMSKLEDEKAQLYSDMQSKGIKNPIKHRKYKTFCDKIEALSFLVKNSPSMKNLQNNIEIMFGKKAKSVELMTIHKSKGLENKRVFFLLPNLIPSSFAVTEIEKAQEQNLKFVALTRASHELIYLHSTIVRKDERTPSEPGELALRT